MDFMPSWVSKMDIEVVSNEKTTKVKTEFEIELELALEEHNKEDYNKKSSYRTDNSLTHKPFKGLKLN